jgi:hypothetical protein
MREGSAIKVYESQVKGATAVSHHA